MTYGEKQDGFLNWSFGSILKARRRRKPERSRPLKARWGAKPTGLRMESEMLRIVRTEEKREVYVDGRRIFLATIGDSGGWGECSAEVAETEMQRLLEEWTDAEPNQG